MPDQEPEVPILDREPPDPPGDPGPIYSPPTVADLRLAAYRERSDPLFFKYRRGESTEQAWLDEVAAIRAEYPTS